MPAEQPQQPVPEEVSIPPDAYYGPTTARAQANFQISGQKLPAELIHAIGIIKASAARTNRELGLLPADQANAIVRAAEEVAAGRLDDQFVVDTFQTGSGTSSHMNANEVIASRANEILTGRRELKSPVHPNDHVNLGQSSNDVFPTAIHLATLLTMNQELLPALNELEQELTRKSAEFADVVKIGRTHLQDAVPVTLGQEFGGYASMLAGNRFLLSVVRPALYELALGGTAVGTGLNTHPEFAVRTIADLARATGLPLAPAGNYFDALGSRRALLATSGMLKALACDLMKIASDLRLMTSGPRCGLGELTLPELQPGSSIMPGKVNPVVPEAVCQVAAQVIGNDMAITVGGQSGTLELNVMMPLLAKNVLESMHLLANACRSFARRCIAGISARRERCAELAGQSLALATALTPRLGYDHATRIVQRAYRENRTLRDVAREETQLSSAELDALLDPHRHALPGTK